MAPSRWQFFIDRGGTFTDCLAVAPDGRTVVTKVLSSDRAPLVAIRRALGVPDDAAIPPCDVRMGTTLATNALLERKGTDTALLITRGFADLLAIGTQARPDIFALDIVKPTLLHRAVLEIDARADRDGHVLVRPEKDALTAALTRLRADGIDSLAVLVLFGHRRPALEDEIAALARAVGFRQISLSHEVANETGALARGDTTVVDAYLTPLLADYLRGLAAELPGSRLRVMQSSGGLTDASRFRGRDSVLSGPAGGVVALAHITRRAGLPCALGFDMGGTSTDVSTFEGELERRYENEIAGVRLRAPMMAVHTVAAGGGSLCRYEGLRLRVGPKSAGADPGPLCYGRSNARDLTITDVNLALGRIAADRFPFPLRPAPVHAALAALATQLRGDGQTKTPTEIAAGFFAIANANMAEAIRQVTTARGRDVRDYAMVVFGGAGGQHACALARMLGIRRLLFHRFAGVLSAYGMGLADVTWHDERDAGARPLADDTLTFVRDTLHKLERQGTEVLGQEGFAPAALRFARRLDLRYQGTDAALTVAFETSDDTARVRARFEDEHQRRFGYVRPEAAVEVVTARLEAVGPGAVPRAPAGVGSAARTPPAPLRRQTMWTGDAFVDAPVYNREALAPGTLLRGPALVLDATGTLALDAGFALRVADEDVAVVSAEETVTAQVIAPASGLDKPDPVRLEIYNNLFMSIASQMGEALRRTAVSTNIRERLDFSCAIFDHEGGLVANAPHIPVHLGAMGDSVQGILSAHPTPAPGWVFASNDPAAGGSHLPDVTVVSPVHDDAGELRFFVASRGHHADIGGITPGSMPPFSRHLDEEGVVLRALPIVKDGRFDEAAVRAALLGATHPARKPGDNVADLEAQIAATRSGAGLLQQLIRQRGAAEVLAYMKHVQDNAAAEVEAAIAALPDGQHHFSDAMDDGTRIAVTLTIAGKQMRVDFTGTGPEQPEGNLNAPRAVTSAAIIYVLRSLVGAPIPLNSGCLRPIELHIPAGCLLSPAPARAVVAGNVETSQRIVDVMLGALGLAAASQGTMNNLTFGNAEFGHYETIAGGAGASARAPGASAVHTHMTNTRITDPEVLESRFPMRLLRFAVRRGSGGAGRHAGGDGVIRAFELLAPMRVSLLCERRQSAPFGLAGGHPGLPGRNTWNGTDVGGRASFDAQPGDHVCIETPGGGGYGAPDR